MVHSHSMLPILLWFHKQYLDFFNYNVKLAVVVVSCAFCLSKNINVG